VEACHKENLIVQDAIEQAVWEPMEQRTASISVDNRVGFGMPKDELDASCNGPQKLLAQVLALILVPAKCILNVRRRGWTEDRHSHRLRSRI
jgi:hypothetical protein